MWGIFINNNTQSLHVKVYINGGDSFWIAPNTDTFLLEDVENINSLPANFNWLTTFEGKSYLNRYGKMEEVMGLLLVKKFGIDWVNNNFSNIKIDTIVKYQNDITTQKIGITYFIIELADGNMYFITKNNDVITKKELYNNNVNEYTWLDTNENYQCKFNRWQLENQMGTTKIQNIKKLFSMFQETIDKNNINEDDVILLNIQKNIPISTAYTSNYDFYLDNYNKSHNPNKLFTNDGLFMRVNFLDFYKGYEEDWNKTHINDNGETVNDPPNYYHRFYRFPKKVSDFEGFCIKVYEYFEALNIFQNPQYDAIKDNNKCLNEIGYYTIVGYAIMNSTDNNFVYRFIKEQIKDIIKLYKKKFTINDFNINELIRKYYHRNDIIKFYFRMFIDYYVDNYIKKEIEEGINVTKKYGITSNNLSKIMFTGIL